MRKTLTPTKKRTEALLDYAQEQGVLLMEGMWTTFMPYMQSIRQHLKSGTIGQAQMVHASFGFRGPDDPSHVYLDPTAGGSLYSMSAFTPWPSLTGCLVLCRVR